MDSTGWRAKAVALPAENTVSAKRIVDNPLQNELGINWKEEDLSKGDFIEIVFRAQRKATKGNNTLRH